MHCIMKIKPHIILVVLTIGFVTPSDAQHHVAISDVAPQIEPAKPLPSDVAIAADQKVMRSPASSISSISSKSAEVKRKDATPTTTPRSSAQREKTEVTASDDEL